MITRQVRLNFVRSDLAMWTPYLGDYIRVGRCDVTLGQGLWVHRATDADVVILGVGQHVPGTLAALYSVSNSRYAKGWDRPWEELATSFFHANLNHTLASLQARPPLTRRTGLAQGATPLCTPSRPSAPPPDSIRPPSSCSARACRCPTLFSARPCTNAHS